MLFLKSIMSRLVPITIHRQLSALIAILISGIAIALFIFIPPRQEKQALSALKNKAETIAAMAAFSAGAPLLFEDREDLDEILASVQQSKDVIFAFVVNQSNQTLSTFQKDGIAFKTELQSIPPLAGQNTLLIEAPILLHNNEIGRLYLGFSTQAVQDALTESRATIALISLIVFAVGLLAVLAMSRIIKTPLSHMVMAAQYIAQGDLSHRTDETSKGEVGQLAIAFNSMTDRVEEYTGDLQREIEERTQAEQALHESEQRLQQIIATNPAVIYTCEINTDGSEPQWIPTFISDNLSRIAGRIWNL